MSLRGSAVAVALSLSMAGLPIAAASAATPDYGDLGTAPGRSSVDQYREDVPDGAARRPSAAERRKLAELGPSAKAYEAALDASADASGVGATGKSGSGSTARGGDRVGRSDSGASSSRTVEQGGVRSGDAGLGPIPLWLAAVAIVLLAVGAAVLRWRRAE